jgi:hypothetical protein
VTDLPAGLGAPAERAFAQAGYTRLEQFGDTTEKDLLRLHGLGPKAIRTLRTALEAHNLTFRTP